MNENPLCREILDHVSSVFVGDRELLQKLLAAGLADGHVLFEDDPGLGKTLLVKAFARAVGLTSRRVQFTPDLLPADVLGMRVWNSREEVFHLQRGPVFTHILLVDEINRAPPKTQSALLEAMGERQVTIEGDTLPLDRPFFVLATQNPIEQEGTYPLPEAQMDRFMLRMSTGYPDAEAEMSILERRLTWQSDDPTGELGPVCTIDDLRDLQKLVEEEVHVARPILRYITDLVQTIRHHPAVDVGPSPRGSLALLRASRALAVVRGRRYVTPDDIADLAEEALAHRFLLNVERSLEGLTRREVVAEAVAQVDADKADMETDLAADDDVDDEEPFVAAEAR